MSSRVSTALLPVALGSAVAVGVFSYLQLRKSGEQNIMAEDVASPAVTSAPPAAAPAAEPCAAAADNEDDLPEDDGIPNAGIDFDRLMSLEHMREFDEVCAIEHGRVEKEQKFNRMRKEALELTTDEEQSLAQQVIARSFTRAMSGTLNSTPERLKKLASAAGSAKREYQAKHLMAFITTRLRTFTCRQLSGLFNELGMCRDGFSLQRDVYELARDEASTSPMLRRFISSYAIREAPRALPHHHTTLTRPYDGTGMRSARPTRVRCAARARPTARGRSERP